MLHVDLDNILTSDELATRADEVLKGADENSEIFVITRNGRPAVAVLKLEHLEDLSGRTVATATPEVHVDAPMEMNLPPVTVPVHEAAPVDVPAAAPVAEVQVPVAEPSTPMDADVITPPVLEASAAMPAPAADQSGLPDMP